MIYPAEELNTLREDDVSQYLREIRRYPLLTQEEERDLARRCAMGDQDAIRQMVNSNLRLVVSVAREYAGRGVWLRQKSLTILWTIGFPPMPLNGSGRV